MKKLTRRTTIKAAAASAIAAPMIIRPYAAYAQRAERLVYWHLPMFTPLADQAAQDLFDEYLKQAGVKPEEAAFITVNNADLVPKLSAALETGSPPDAARLYESYVQLYRAQGHMMDVTELVDNMKGEEGGLFESSLRAVAKGGSYWGVPFAINPWPMHARNDLLAEAGLSYPATWDEFIETCKTLQQPPFYGFGMDLGLTQDASDNIMQLLWCYGGYTTDDDGNVAFDNSGNVEGFKVINRMYNEDKIIPKGVVGNADTAWNNRPTSRARWPSSTTPPPSMPICSTRTPTWPPIPASISVPAGPAGSVNQIDTWSTGIFKQAPEPELVRGWVAYLMNWKTTAKCCSRPTAASCRSTPSSSTMNGGPRGRNTRTSARSPKPASRSPTRAPPPPRRARCWLPTSSRRPSSR
ncbi:MAG: extracellular solute-binding protein [Geminicoccaceae bacterium]